MRHLTIGVVSTATNRELPTVSMDESNDKTHTFVPLVNGTMVSHYRIVEKIGAGGMGEVHVFLE
jgi:hypothetical protein